MSWEAVLFAFVAGAFGGVCAWFGVRARSRRQLQEWLRGIVKEINAEKEVAKDGD